MKKILLLGAAVLCMHPSLFAQESSKFEIGAGVSYGIGLEKTQPNQYGFDIFGGYRFNKHFSAGAGIGYSHFLGRSDLPSGIDNVYIQTDDYNSVHPYVYGRYDFFPGRKWSPFVGAKLGYGIFPDSRLKYAVGLFPGGFGSAYGEAGLADYEYLQSLDHNLGVAGGVYSSIDLGVSRALGRNGGKLSLSVSLDLQPVRFNYSNSTQKRVNPTIGPSLGFIF